MAADVTSLAALGARLVPLHETAAEAVLRFERDNRAFFRRWVPDRGDDYFSVDAVDASLVRARGWWEAGSDRMHVVVDGDGVVLGRANLVEIADGRGLLGYRVGETAAGRGLASAAVAALVEAAPGWDVQRIVAETTHDNLGSQRVLARCGFTAVGARAAALQVGDRYLDAMVWERRIAPPG